MKHSKAHIRARFHKIPTLRFEGQKLTSFAGLVLFQALFVRLQLKARLKACFTHLNTSSSYGVHRIVLLYPAQIRAGLTDIRGTLAALLLIFGVATFYHLFMLKPKGRHACVVCTGTACYIKGAGGLVEAIQSRYDDQLLYLLD